MRTYVSKFCAILNRERYKHLQYILNNAFKKFEPF